MTNFELLHSAGKALTIFFQAVAVAASYCRMPSLDVAMGVSGLMSRQVEMLAEPAVQPTTFALERH